MVHQIQTMNLVVQLHPVPLIPTLISRLPYLPFLIMDYRQLIFIACKVSFTIELCSLSIVICCYVLTKMNRSQGLFDLLTRTVQERKREITVAAEEITV